MPVYAVGIGPGPLDLLTLRAEKILRIQWEYVLGISFVQAASLATGDTLVGDRDTLVVTRVEHASELDDIFRIATVVVLYDVALDKMAELSSYAIQRGRVAKTTWIGPDQAKTYAVDLMQPEPPLRGGSVVLSRHHAAPKE